MSRRHITQSKSLPDIPYAANCIFYAPLTSDSYDIVGGKTSLRDAISYGADGAYFNTNNSSDYLMYALTEAELKSIKTTYCEFIYAVNKTSTQTLYWIGTSRAQPYVSGNPGASRIYPGIWKNHYFLDAKINKNAVQNTNSYDIDLVDYNTNIAKNTVHKCANCVYSNRALSFLDGVKILSHTHTDTFNAYDITPDPYGCYLCVGNRVASSEKIFNGYVRNVMMWDIELTDQQLQELTTLS